MAGTINKVLIIGNLGRDPEIKETANGGKIANLSVATSEQWNDRQSGERKERTEWHRIVTFDERLVDVIQKYLSKGSKIYVEGQLQTRKWQGQDGQDRYTTEIVIPRFRGVLQMLDGRSGSSGDQSGGGPAPAERQHTASPSSDNHDEMEDSIPF